MNIDTEDYVIDYMAFNFIGKVIDTPELWAKFVHKKLAHWSYLSYILVFTSHTSIIFMFF